MQIEIFKTPEKFHVQCREINGVSLWCVGRLHDAQSDSCQLFFDALIAEGRLRSQEELQSRVSAFRGNFACIVKDARGHVFACVDKIKSYPLFYREERDRFLLSFDPYMLKYASPRTTWNEDAALEFAMSGYVTCGETLYTEIRQLRGGEYLFFDGKTATVHAYYRFYHPTVTSRSKEEWIETLHNITVDIFHRLITRLHDRPVWVPLSGGLDSRLVIVMLKHLGYKRLQTFSYGVPGNCEAKAASRIAKRLGVPWFFVPYTRSFGRSVYWTKERERYFHLAHALSGIPTMTDFYAFYALKKEHRIPADAVIVNGQTGDFISGAHIPSVLDREMPSRADLLQGIVRKHYALWTHLSIPENIARMEQRIVSAIDMPLSDVMQRDEAMQLYELWEWRGRQCETVIPGQRVYDFFDLSWELPLWDDAYLDFWSTVPFTLKYEQALYCQYLATFDFYGLFRTMQFRRYTPPFILALLSPLFTLLGKKQNDYRRLFLQYWQKYAYFYAIYPYREYFRSARYHRNPSSYLARDILKEEYHKEAI